MNDMSKVIEPRTDQINADTLISGPMTVTIKSVKIVNTGEQPVTMMLDETPLFYRPCKSMCRLMTVVWGANAANYPGRAITLYRDPSIKWGGLEVGGIRISHMSHMEAPFTVALTASRGSRKPFTVKPLVIEKAPAQQKASKPQPEPRPLAESEMLLRAAAASTNGRAVENLKAMWFDLDYDSKAALKPLMDSQLKTQAQANDAKASAPEPAQEAGKASEPVTSNAEWLQGFDGDNEEATK